MNRDDLSDGIRKPNSELDGILDYADGFAKSIKVGYLTSEIILYAIVSGKGRASMLLINHGLKAEDVLKAVFEINAVKDGEKRVKSRAELEAERDGKTARVKRLSADALAIAERTGCPYVATEHYLYAMTKLTNCAAGEIMRTYCDYGGLVKRLEEIIFSWSPKPRARDASYAPAVSAKPDEKERGYRPENEAQDYSDRPERYKQNAPSIEGTILEKFGYDLTAKARRGKLDPVIGRDAETEKIINALSRRNKNSPLLIGEPGTGKSAVVEGLARRIAQGNVPASLKNKIIYSLELSGIIAGAKYKGDFEERFREMIKYVQDHEIILFIDEIHNLLSGAKSDGMDASEILKPALARGELQIIGATTISEYRKYFEKDSALERRFSVIMVEPPSVGDCITIIRGLKDGFEAHHCVAITDEAIVAAVRLSDRFITDRFLPDKAIDIIDEAAARSRLALETIDKEILTKEEQARDVDNEIDYARSCGRSFDRLVQRLNEINDELDKLYDKHNKIIARQTPFVDADDVATVVAEKTGIPVAKLTETEKEKFLNLEKYLKKRVVGQDNAVKAVSFAIRRTMSGIGDPSRPNGVFLFVGPTGVGKTELAKALAEALFADESKLIRIDMSEYMEKASVAKLIGAPPGYVGYDEEGQLTEKVRRNKFAVILFDEVEKAHPDVFNIMLQIFDDGRLTDSKGRLVDFKNTVIILTSNAGAKDAFEARSSIGFGQGSPRAASVKDAFDRALRQQFSPEFLNRIDEIVYFDRLTKEGCCRICVLIIEKFKKRLAEKNISFIYDESVVSLIVEACYTEEYGARPLKRAVAKYIEDEIAERLLSGEIEEGANVYATGINGEIKFIVE